MLVYNIYMFACCLAHHSCMMKASQVCTCGAGRLEAGSKTPAELQQQLHQAQQQNQTLARILAERCEQAVSHVEQQQQLQDMWQHLVSLHAVPSGATVQVRSHTPMCM